MEETNKLAQISSYKLFYEWFFSLMPKMITKIYKYLNKSCWHYFSIEFLLKTLFQPYRRDITIPINPTLSDLFKAFIDNAISRLVGAFIRFFTIITGLFAEVIINILLVFTLVLWYALPILFILSLIKCFMILFT